jgi:hypothetical protein
MAAGSVGRRNTCVRLNCWSLEAQGLSGPLIQAQRNLVEGRLGVTREIDSFWKILLLRRHGTQIMLG